MMKWTPLVLIVCVLSLVAYRTQAGDEYQEAIQQTEDEWVAVQATLTEGKEALDNFSKKLAEYRAAAFSDSPEKGLELARILFKLDKNQTQAAAAKVQAMRDMFNKLDESGLSDKLATASGYLNKANDYAGKVDDVWQFTKKFNPDNAKDNPTYGLRLIGTLLSESASKMEKIPLIGEILGPWVKAYGEVAGDFANALDRLGKKIDDFRGGSLCGQLGRRQGQQAAYKAAGGTDCLTHFATGIFPRLRGEAYEGDEDYFLYDPATERGYIASKQAEIVYRWHGSLLEPRALDPDWLAGRANSLTPETISHARELYVLFKGWAEKSALDWVVVDKLGLYQDAYLYGRLDENAFMGNYVLARKHHQAINAVLAQYEKYVVFSGAISEEETGRPRRLAGVLVEFTVGDKVFSETTGQDGCYEVLIEAQVNDRVYEKITKTDYETITADGRIPQKAVSGLDYTLVKDSAAVAAAAAAAVAGAALGDDDLGFQVGPLVIKPGLESPYTGTRFAVGDPIRLQIEVTESLTGPAIPLTAEWRVTMPDGRLANPAQSRLLAADGVSGALTNNIRTDEHMPLGVYQVEAALSLSGTEVRRRHGSFELLPLFEDPELVLTDSEDGLLELEKFRPADPIFMLARMTYNSVDPDRQVHLTVDLTGPDPAIGALAVTADQSYFPGPITTGAAQRIPDVIQEGVYTVTVRLEGGFAQHVTLQRTFQISYPVQFDDMWTLDGLTPPAIKSRFSGNDPCQWRMRYNFTDARPGDEYFSAVWCHLGEVIVNMLSTEKLGPDAPEPGPAITTFNGLIPMEMPAGAYQIDGLVWYNGVAYTSPGTTIKVGQEPIITITSPQPGFVVNEKVLVVRGTCADQQLRQATMITNHESVPIKLQNGEFSAKTVLRPGQNEIRIIAENEVGTSEADVFGTADIQASALKIVLSWEAQGTDVDLWVTDPEGVETCYQHKHPAEGRQLDVDDQSGPGMETYTVEVPLRGQYGVAVHYYKDGGWQGTVPFNLQITTWETTFNERHGHLEGTLYKAAGSRDEPGAVAYFTVQLP